MTSTSIPFGMTQGLEAGIREARGNQFRFGYGCAYDVVGPMEKNSTYQSIRQMDGTSHCGATPTQVMGGEDQAANG